MNKLISSALDRLQHFQFALSFFESLFQKEDFHNNFLELLNDLIQTERSSQSKNQVFLIAIGKSAGVARLASSMFMSVGLPVHFVHPTEAFHGDFGVVDKNDTVVFISNSGNSPELLQLIPGLVERNVKIYTMTSMPKSPLAMKSQCVLQLPEVEEKCPLYQSPITSTLTSLALCQLLVAATVEKRNFSVEDYARNHPGGSIGKKIFLKVDVLMAKELDLPLIQQNLSFQKLISTFTSFAKACLLVVNENNDFLGLIAERDLRKAMEKFGPTVFEKTAADIMNPKPILIESGSLAIDALKLMTLKKPYLNVLPVVSKQGKAIGVVQIQDVLALGL